MEKIFLTNCLIALILTVFLSWNSNAQSNEQCTVTVNGQRVATGPIGSRFTLRNIPAGNQFVRACIICTDENGETLYALSERFQITNNETFLLLDDLNYSSTPPPTLRSLNISPDSNTILAINDSLQLQVKAQLSDETEEDVTQRILGTTYASSNSQIVSVTRDGLAIGIGVGSVAVTAINGGVTAVKQIIVAESVLSTTIEGFVFDENGDPIVGAQVTTGFGGTVITDANGFYSIPLQIPSGSSFTIQVLIPDQANPLIASISDLSIVNNGITDAGIIVPCPSAPGLVSWWPGEGTAEDLIGENDGILQGGLTFGPGNVGQGFQFDGVNDYIEVADDPSLEPGINFSFLAWIKPDNLSGSRMLISKVNRSTSEFSYYINIRDRVLDFDCTHTGSFSSPDNIVRSTTAIIQTDIWQHVAVVYDGSLPIPDRIKMYVDGAEISTQLVLGTIPTSIPDVATPSLLGAYRVGLLSPFSGLMDDVEFYNRSLSNEEIQEIYQFSRCE